MADIWDKATGLAHDVLDGERDARNKLLDEAGLTGTGGRLIASVAEIAVGGTMVGLGLIGAESGVGLAVAGGGALIAADGVKGISDNLLQPTTNTIKSVLGD